MKIIKLEVDWKTNSIELASVYLFTIVHELLANKFDIGVKEKLPGITPMCF